VILVQLSDPHVSVRDWSAGDALALAVRAVLGVRPTPDAAVVSGDIADGADPREYARARELLRLLPMPVHVLAGNHDDRERLRDAFGGPEGPRRWVVDVAGVRVVGCDTSIPGSTTGAGALGADGLAWLDATLADGRDVPTIVAMHHPPLPIAMDSLDAIGLDAGDAAALASLLAETPWVVRVIAGHVHRTAFGSVGGREVVACPSTHLQARLALDGEPLEMVPEPPGMVLHVWRGGRLVSHVQPIV
jgi:3',5'-cyclic AMP phosphodiesterase CpdA